MTSPAVQKLGVGTWRLFWGHTRGGMLGAMARNAPARPATPQNGQRLFFCGICPLFEFM
jgi:hypothetical protein